MLILIKHVKKYIQIKKRPKNNPLIVHYYNSQILKKDCNLMIILTNYIKNFVLDLNIYFKFKKKFKNF